jgi:hypothetical protein
MARGSLRRKVGGELACWARRVPSSSCKGRGQTNDWLTRLRGAREQRAHLEDGHLVERPLVKVVLRREERRRIVVLLVRDPVHTRELAFACGSVLGHAGQRRTKSPRA